MGHIRAAFILTLFFLTALVVAVPLQTIALALRLPASRTIPHRYYRFLCRLLGIRIETHGDIVTDGPLLIAANHTSYFDIPILGALAPVAFIAKEEVKAWPFFGLCADLGRTIFVDRKNRSRALVDRDKIQARLRQGDSLVLFPEATSSDGNGILPFKSALLSVAELDLAADEARKGRAFRCRVQPVSIAYTRLNGVPMGRIKRPLFAWYGDMDLMPHLWAALAAGPFDVTVEFHPPVTAEQMGDRKALTQHCERVVREGVIKALNGRSSGPWIAFGGAATARQGDGTSNKAAALPLA